MLQKFKRLFVFPPISYLTLLLLHFPLLLLSSLEVIFRSREIKACRLSFFIETVFHISSHNISPFPTKLRTVTSYGITILLSNPGYLRLPWWREWAPLRLELVTSSCISEIFLTVATFVCRSLRCSHLDRFCPHGNIADGSVLFLCPVCYLWPGDSSASCNTGQRQNV